MQWSEEAVVTLGHCTGRALSQGKVILGWGRCQGRERQ